jgi:UPF0042 nucleotide-binding protein
VTQFPESAGASKPEVVIITGMSGAGRSAAANVLEDLGWFVVDNLPPALLPALLDLDEHSQNAPDRIGVVADVRSRQFFTHLNVALEELAGRGIDPRVVFLEASDEALVRRFESVRRPHPLQGQGRVLDGIAAEREYLRDLRADADLVIDTSVLNVHQLAAKLVAAFGAEEQPTVRATLVSFGYKYGIPVDADLLVDCRFLPNPHWVPELRPQTGLDAEVSDYVLGQKGAVEFLDRYPDILELLAEGFVREGKRYMTVAVGCTGGKHRSVAMAEALAGRLRDVGMQTLVVHRDLGRE